MSVQMQFQRLAVDCLPDVYPNTAVPNHRKSAQKGKDFLLAEHSDYSVLHPDVGRRDLSVLLPMQAAVRPVNDWDHLRHAAGMDIWTPGSSAPKKVSFQPL